MIGLCLNVHPHLGPGLLESAYHQCLAYELSSAKIPFEMEKEIPIHYKDVYLNCGYRIDILVDQKIILEIKSVESLMPIHEAQLLTYMKLAKMNIGLLINFNARTLKGSIRRFIL
ncbi:GxxExxY protein [Kamptonema cortianum]|nr:GxxExxY protein [Kamptonema cortianum]MDL5050309.1 GxxExxY protein [Oscillatoria amoena NRMC-F 0135]MDL5055141.1 GxxExxY protein [Oscillatoria laete-virens NRMC-F 0139]